MKTLNPIGRLSRGVLVGGLAVSLATFSAAGHPRTANSQPATTPAGAPDPRPTGPFADLQDVFPDAPESLREWAAETRRLSLERMADASHQRAARAPATPAVVRTETERAGTRGANDTRATAGRLRGFGTGDGSASVAKLRGTLSPAKIPDAELTTIPPSTEDDGTFAKARDTGIPGQRKGIKTRGTIGDGPDDPFFGNDQDTYRLNLTAGEILRIRMTATSGDLEPYLQVFDTSGFFSVADSYSGDGRPVPTESLVTFAAPTTGPYYVQVTGELPIDDPFGDPTTGTYELTVQAGQDDVDTWTVDLQAGDVLSAILDTPGVLSVSGPTGAETIRSQFDLSFLYPLESPLRGAGGKPSASYVAPRAGRYFVDYRGGDGSYEGRLDVFRPGSGRAATQTIFLDTDGARINTRIWRDGNGVITVPPLSAYLDDWGLAKSQERPLVDAIKANLRENLQRDLAATGLTDAVKIKIVSSLDTPDLTGRTGVTRMILGGDPEDTGLGPVGVAESIDPGNFDRTETGLVQLGVLSGPRSDDKS
ncbi:MAG: PPC domain-containing protein, partial [Nocardioides sp.]